MIAAADLVLDQSSAVPLYRQIHDRIAAAVLDGRLMPGARLPSARSLAAQLGIARGTVEAAYQLLAGEGYILARGAAGTLVDPALDRTLLRPARHAGGKTARVATVAEDGPGLFQLGLPALDAFPHKIWARLIARRARALRPADHAYQPAAGALELRTQIARYLAVARGVSAAPGQIFVTSGYQGALGLITRVLAKPGDAAWVEDPGYPNGHAAIRQAQLNAIGIPVDRDGFDVGWAAAKAKPARIALVSPTHQFPLGVTLSLQRRMALLKWAESTEGWIVEDDYDSEFRYQGRPLPALKSLDRRDRVLYVGTFSKVLSPGLRVGYLVVPPALVAPVMEIAARLQPPPAMLVQAAIAEFLEQGHLARHIRRMRTLYAERRNALAEALRAHVRPTLDIELQPGGMHLMARLPNRENDIAIGAALRRHGLTPTPLSACGVEKPYAPGLLFGFTNVEARHATRAARRLADALAVVRKLEG